MCRCFGSTKVQQTYKQIFKPKSIEKKNIQKSKGRFEDDGLNDVSNNMDEQKQQKSVQFVNL